MQLQEEYAKQIELVMWINDRFKINFPTDRRSLIALGCFDLVIEHHAAVCALCSGQLYGSMFALLRILFEAYVRGAYLRHCASEEELDHFERDRLDKEFRRLIADVEKTIGLEPSPLSILKRNSWNIMNSFTHTGFQHLVRRHTVGKTGPLNYPEQEICQSLNLAGAFALLSAGELASLTGNQSLVEDVFSRMTSYVG